MKWGVTATLAYLVDLVYLGGWTNTVEDTNEAWQEPWKPAYRDFGADANSLLVAVGCG